MEKTKKIYAVRQGRKVGLFYSWAECEQQIKGYSGAQYKSFTDPNEANQYLEQVASSFKDTELPRDEMIAYVDGSYNGDTGEYSAGVVLLYQSNKKTFSIKDNDPLLSKMRNVAGEIMGAKAAMNYALENNVENLAIYYDYAGIEKWCTGEWQTKMEGTKSYKNFYDDISKAVTIRFVKVKAHSGVSYNEEADKLAREALQMVSLDTDIVVSSKHQKSSIVKFEAATIYIQHPKGTISDKQILQDFKTMWKKSGRKLNEIKKLDIFIDTNNNEYKWQALTTNGTKEGSESLAIDT